MPKLMISLSLTPDLLQKVDSVWAAGGYHSRTDFIESALRDKCNQVEKKGKSAISKKTQ